MPPFHFYVIGYMELLLTLQLSPLIMHFFILAPRLLGIRHHPFLRKVFPKQTMSVCGWVGVFWPSGYLVEKPEKLCTP